MHTKLYATETSRNPKYNTPESNRTQQDRPSACVIVQQYSSTTIASLFFCSRKENSVLIVKMSCESFSIINMALSLNIKKLDIALNQAVTLYLLKTKDTCAVE
jgi:hypothetical protein